MLHYLKDFLSSNILDWISNIYVFAYSIIDCRMMIGISGESAGHSLHIDVMFIYLLCL